MKKLSKESADAVDLLLEFGKVHQMQPVAAGFAASDGDEHVEAAKKVLSLLNLLDDGGPDDLAERTVARPAPVPPGSPQGVRAFPSV